MDKTKFPREKTLLMNISLVKAVGNLLGEKLHLE